MGRLDQKPSRSMTAIVMLWLVLGVAGYWQIQKLNANGYLASQAKLASQIQRRTVPAVHIPKINPGSWPPPANKAEPMAADLTAPNYLVIFDGSFSMNQRGCSGPFTKLQAAKTAVKQFINALAPNANVGVVGFGDSPYGTNRSFEHPMISGDRTRVFDLLDSVRGLGTTPLVRAVSRGFEMLEAQARRQAGYGQYHMVILTDGVSTDGDPSMVAKTIVRKTAIKIHAIGFCLDGGHGLNIPGYTNYSKANDQEALERGLQGVLAESEAFDPVEFIKP